MRHPTNQIFEYTKQFQSTHLLRGATCFFHVWYSYILCFNPRTSCEVRPMIEGNAYLRNRFQFTHLLRGATYLLCHFFCMVLFQFTHLLRGATIARLLLRAMIYVSIHAPLARCDAPGATDTTKLTGFNSRTSCEVRPSESVINRLPDLFQFTHLLRGATTTHNRTSDNRSNVSIHAPLARCDVLLKYPAL